MSTDKWWRKGNNVNLSTMQPPRSHHAANCRHADTAHGKGDHGSQPEHGMLDSTLHAGQHIQRGACRERASLLIMYRLHMQATARAGR